jgi:hypothetical protein
MINEKKRGVDKGERVNEEESYRSRREHNLRFVWGKGGRCIEEHNIDHWYFLQVTPSVRVA